MKKLNSFISSVSFSYLILFVFLTLLFSCKTVEPGQQAKKSGSSNDKNGLSDKQKLEFDYLFFNANKEKILGNFDLAETSLLQALKINPSNSAALYELANIYVYKNNKIQALNYSKKAALIDSKNIWYQLLYAECLKENKQIDDLIEVYEKLIKTNPNKIEFYYELANAYLYKNRPTEALKIYDKMESKIGITDDVSMQKIKIYKALKNYDKGIEELKKLSKMFPKEPKYYGILGEFYQEKNQPEKAMEAYTDLLKIDPENALVHLNLADYYRNQKQNDKAFAEIKIAFKNKDLDIDTKIKILLSYFDITEKFPDLKPDADTLCKIVVMVHPEEAKGFAMYGDFLNRDKKLEEARTQYRKAIALDSSKFAIWSQLLIIDSDLNDFNSLIKDSKVCIDLFPNQALPYFFNGAANIQLKNYSVAIEKLNEGKEFVFDNKPFLSQFYSNLGDAYNYLKNYDLSDASYDKALELDEKNSYVMNNYAYYLSLRKSNLEKAETMSKKSNELAPNNSSYQDTYGWILFQMKKYDDAKVWIGKAIENGGKSNGTLLEHYGDILYKLGDTNEALRYWKDAKLAGGTTDLIDKKITDKKLYE